MKLDDVQKNYDRVAERYDTWTELIFGRLLGTERLREHTLDLLGDIDGKVVLDVGCGTGRNLPFLVHRVGTNGRVIGVDYSQGMLDVARARIDREGWQNVDLRQDDAAKLATIDRPVDAVVSVWTMGIVHDLNAALGRAVDVLEPGGRVAIMDFDRSRPDHGWLRWLYSVYSPVLKWSGIDSAEDLNDARLRAKWQRGRAVLERRIGHIKEERYLGRCGVIISGTAPRTEDRP
jgi:ubiquinone/menaquinone biosynthesis C-methylase UbiE